MIGTQRHDEIRGHCPHCGALVYAGAYPAYTETLVCQWCAAPVCRKPPLSYRLAYSRKQMRYRRKRFGLLRMWRFGFAVWRMPWETPRGRDDMRREQARVLERIAQRASTVVPEFTSEDAMAELHALLRAHGIEVDLVAGVGASHE